MATEGVSECDKAAKTPVELLAFVKKELDADAERNAKLQASGAGELPHESQTGVTLDLGHKNLRVLPLEVIALIKDKVERLALSHNPQISVPIQIAQCERLRYLNIRWNQLIHFPEAVLQLTQLEILDVSKNRITAIPEEIRKLTSLKFLAVSRNRITRLPYALGEMSSLGKLKFDENPIEFPPPDALKLPSDSSASAFEAEREKDTCQRVKRYLRAAAVKEKLKTVSEEDLSEANLETPRPPKRAVTGGRFPIRPSLSGLENMTDPKSDAPPPVPTPPIPQRSHARGESSTTSVSKRPGITPLLTGGNDVSRSQSETVSSAVNLRQRRQGFVPSRKPTGGLGSVSEVESDLTQAISTSATHSRAASSISITSDGIAPGSIDTPGVLNSAGRRFDNFHTLAILPGYRNLKKQGNSLIKASKRLVLTLRQLEVPVSDLAATIKDDRILTRSTVERQLFTAQAQVKELDRLLNRLEAGVEDSRRTRRKITNAIIRAAVNALKSYGAVTAELKRKREDIITRADGIYLRSLLFEIYGGMVEARNICTVLGYTVRDAASSAVSSRQVSQAWSSKSVTPTQPKAPTARRIVQPQMLHNVNSSTSIRGMAPPPIMPLSTNPSRTNTMTSQSTTLVANSQAPSRTNTMRSIVDDGGEEQFDQIFLKLQGTCNVASQALPHCRTELQSRRENAQSTGPRNIAHIAHQLSLALGKCDEVVANNKALKKRLEIVKVNEPGLRYQRDFWQLCDAFVHSWTEFATEVKELSTQGIDMSTVKNVMRNVQKQVKDVSKTIFNSPLYHHAIGSSTTKMIPVDAPTGALPTTTELASPFPSPSPWKSHQYAAHNSVSSTHSQHGGGGGGGYVSTTPVPATPLSVALGPAVQATVATTPNASTTTGMPREYFQEPPTARLARDRDRDRERERDRNDTPMQTSYARRS